MKTRGVQIAIHLAVIGLTAFATVSTGGAIMPVLAAAISGAVGVIWQSSNTNGTPQSTPFPATPVKPVTTKTP